MYKQIEGWYEPTDVLRLIPNYRRLTHMSRDEHGFISGIIKKVRPKKILEVGVAEGGTTAMIVQTLEMLECECEMFSCDLLQSYRGRDVGSLLKILPEQKYVKHTLITGKLLKDSILNMGGGIDLVILDTSHNIPGEIIEFLTALPFMSKDCMVILHDVSLCNLLASRPGKGIASFRKICTKVLFGSVSAEKYFNYRGDAINNIAAFKINGTTWDNIEDIFFSLSHLWYFGFSNEDLSDYRNFLSKYYRRDLLEIWDLYVKNQNEYRKNIDKTHKYLKWLDKYLKAQVSINNKIKIYSFYQKYLKKKR